MKKFLIVFLTVMVSASLFIGCDEKNSANTSHKSNKIEVFTDDKSLETNQQGNQAGAGYAFDSSCLRAFPWDKYGDYVPVIFHGDTNIVLVSNETEAGELFGETYSMAYSYEENAVVKNTHFQDVISKYNEHYFENHQVLTFFLLASDSGVRHELESVDYIDGVLTVILNRLHFSGGANQAVKYWFAMVEIDSIPADTLIDIKVERSGKFIDPDSRFYIYPDYYTLTP